MNKQVKKGNGKNPPTFLIWGREYTLAKLIYFAERALKKRFGVCNLSIIERAHLRHSVLRVAESIENTWKMYEAGKISLEQIPSFEEEAAWLWLNELYGVEPTFIKANLDRYGVSAPDPGFYKWLWLKREQSHLP